MNAKIETLTFDDFIENYDFAGFYNRSLNLYNCMELIKQGLPKKEIIKQYTEKLYAQAKKQIKREKSLDN